MVRLKYEAQIADLKDCPPASAREVPRLAYRFVRAPLDQTSFVPPQALNPTRTFQNTHGLCAAHALSFFTSEELARSYFAELEKKRRNIRLAIGDYLAAVRIAPGHGLQTAPNPKGHFDLHPYDDIDLLGVSEILGEL